MMGPGFGEAAAAYMLGRFLLFVVLPIVGAALALGLLIGWWLL